MSPVLSERVTHWRRYLDALPAYRRRHDAYALHACRLAVEAMERGTYGVGAVLFDGEGRVIVEGRNKVYEEGFRSDLHAEMVLMNEYEASGRSREYARHCTLVTSLEPCPMCMARLIVAGVGAVLYVSGDAHGGMVQRKHALPPTFRAIIRGQGQVWRPADCSHELRDAAFRIWIESRERLAGWLPGAPRATPDDERVAVS